MEAYEPPSAVAWVQAAAARRRYVLGLVRGAERDFFETELLPAHVTDNPDLHVVRELKSAKATVLEMTPDPAARLHDTLARSHAQHGVVLEEDAYFRLATTARDVQRPNTLSVTALPVSTSFSLVGRNDEPIADARVSLMGSFGAIHGVTDSRGQVQLTLYDELQPPVLDAVHVRPRADYWSYWERSQHWI